MGNVYDKKLTLASISLSALLRYSSIHGQLFVREDYCRIILSLMNTTIKGIFHGVYNI